jgi:hypothetical protein
LIFFLFSVDLFVVRKKSIKIVAQASKSSIFTSQMFIFQAQKQTACEEVINPRHPTNHHMCQNLLNKLS